MPRGRNPYPGASPYQDRHGKVRWRYRAKGRKDVPLPSGGPGADGFREAYESAVASRPAVAASRSAAGTFDALIAAFYSSAAWTNPHKIVDSTRATYRGILERFRAEHGSKRVAHLRTKDIRRFMDQKAETPAAANNMLRMLRMLMAFAVEREVVDTNPALGIKPLPMNPEGFHTWTDAELDQFRSVHPIGSRARLAFALMLSLGQRGRSDVTRLGRQHVRDGRIIFKQKKTQRGGSELSIAIDDELADAIAAMPATNLTFLVTRDGAAFTPAGFGNWFGDMVRAAGLPKRCVAHGLRKAAARQLAETGATEREIMAVTGHRTSKEVSRYTRAASQPLLADAAQAKRARAKREQTLANQGDEFANTIPNPLKIKVN